MYRYIPKKYSKFIDTIGKVKGLISIPDISKWKTQCLKEMFSLYSDCILLLFIPDISEWDNYNEDNLNERPDYNRINELLNFYIYITVFSTSPENDELLYNIGFMKKKLKDKAEKFLN